MRIVVTGSRALTHVGEVQRCFWAARKQALIKQDDAHEWHHGGARGVDDIVDAYLRGQGAAPIVHRPDYATYGNKNAPHVRNDEMLNLNPDLVIAIWNGRPGGTQSVIEKAARKGIAVIVEVSSS